MVSNDPISEYMQRHGCGFPDALEALAARLGPPTAHDVRRALQTLGRDGVPVDLLEALEGAAASAIVTNEAGIDPEDGSYAGSTSQVRSGPHGVAPLYAPAPGAHQLPA